MGLRGKMVALFIIGFGLMAFITLQLLEKNLHDQFLAIEHKQADAQMAQVTRSLNGEMARLSQTADDLANDDNTYNFIKHPSKNFSDRQFTSLFLKEIEVNFISILDDQGNTLLSETGHLATSNAIITSSSDHTLADAKNRVAHSTPEPEKACGLAMSTSGPILLCWQPVRGSDRTAKAVGTVILSRLVNDRLVNKIQSQNNINFSLMPLPVPKADFPVEFKNSIEAVNVEFSKTEPAILNATLPDFIGQPILKVRLQYPVEISTQSHEVALALGRTLLLVSVITGLLLFFSVHLLVIGRLQKMGMELRRIWRNGRWAERIDISNGSDELNEFAQAVNRMLGLIRKQVMILDSLAHTDSLTQIANRRAFDRRILIEMSLHNRNQTPLSILIVDIDHFKHYNDYFGYPAGDDLLIEIGKLLMLVACRPADLPARIGGEEFAVILPATDINGACHVAQLLQSRLADLKIPQAGSANSEFVTISVGVASATDDDVESFIQRAEKAVFNAKQSGRNRISTLADE